MEENNNENTILEEETRTPNMTSYSDSELAEVVEWSHNYTNGRRGGQEGENVITNITLHIVDGDWGAGGFKSFAHTDRQASSHYGIASDGTIVQMVSEANTAWTNGGTDSIALPNPVGSGTVGYNTNSVTIEISNLRVINKTGANTFVASDGNEYNFKVENGQTLIEMNGQYYKYPITNAALDSTIRLVADIAKRNNIGELYHDGYNGTLTWHRDFPGVYKACPGDYVIAMTDYICDSANMINKVGYYIPDYGIESENSLLRVVLSTESNPFDSGTVASDMYLTVNSINNIRGSMGVSDIQSPVYNSTSTIPGDLLNAQSSLLGISSDLSTSLNNETKVISSIAQLFFDMDRERTNAANALSDGSELLFDESGYIDAMNQLISTDLSFQVSFDNFMFNPFSHTEGNSGKICLSDLNSMLSGSSLAGPLHENFENERNTARNTKNEIDNLASLISNGTNFKGDIWKKVGERLTNYSDLMNLRIESADKLESAIAKAIKLIVDYMGDYEELDDSKLPELKESAEKAKKNILDAQNIVNATHTVTKTYEDEDGYTKYYYVTEYVYSASARSEARAYISTTTALLKEINEEINKLENLPIVLAEAEQIINDALTEIYGNYGAKVSNVVTGNTVSYIPPENTNYVAPAYSRVEVFNPKPIVEGKVDEGSYYMSSELQGQYGSYEDYLNGVLRVNNPMYNSEMEDNGIEPGQSLDDKIFDREDDDIQEDTTSTPDIDEDNGTTNNVSPNPVNPSPSPSEPVVPETPSEPVVPETPSEPVVPDTPSEPVVPDTPSDPIQPDTPSEPIQPDTPSEPVKPDTPSDPVKPDTPSKPTQPESPNVSIQPDTPSNPVIPDDNEVPPVVDIPEDLEPIVPPIVDIPEETPVVDITPPIKDDTSSDSGEGMNLGKVMGISLGVGAAVGAAALGAHTVKKAKENYDYED